MNSFNDTSADDTARSFDVSSASVAGRLDAYLAEQLAGEGVSRGKVQDLIKGGKVFVDGTVRTKPKFKLMGGETVDVALELPGSGIVPEQSELDVLFEDGRVAVIHKTAGLTVHPAPGRPAGTLVHQLAHRFPKILEMEGERPGIVHRIDKDTSGLLLVALDEASRLALSADFAERRVDKRYLALVHGVPQGNVGNQGTIDAPIGRHPRSKTKMAVVEKGGRDALSDWEVLWSTPDGSASMVAVTIHTGRTHQIRVHMAHLGHPLLGDVVYGSRQHAEWCRDSGLDPALAGRQMLHAWRLGFTHPHSGERLEFVLPPAEDFQRLALSLGQSVQRVGVVGMPGCGKSTVAALLAEAGAPLFSADQCVAELYEEEADGWIMLRRRFGEKFAPTGSAVDKAQLFAAMRSSEGMRREILDVVHPLVRHRMTEFWRSHRREDVAVAEVPLLLEGGWVEQGLADVVVGVSCTEGVRRARLATRGWDEETVATLESWQWAEADKLAACDFVVDNGGTLEDLKQNVAELLRQLVDRRRESRVALENRLNALWAGNC
ncbi:dephospho-CoA kinase [Desulfovibrio ferrophilus]|uniref:Dephospho-CoA kinase n=1 Tax=Desulfovibrio ferrophilus TaxID=241368 RepID=A0A2Z6AYJ7_9BACT|nr:dephospho-CoA kinase [Desulfovibrio ferrophilus]BBD08319.1 dephospho-CoA kinase [Desulfovibrio ferrophilus]